MAGPGAQSAAARAGDSGEQVHGQGEHEVLQLHNPHGPGHHGTGRHLHHRGGKTLLLLSNTKHLTYTIHIYISDADISVDDGVRQSVVRRDYHYVQNI